MVGRICGVALFVVSLALGASLAVAAPATPPAPQMPAAASAAKAPSPEFAGYRKEVQLFVLSMDGRIALTADEDENNFLWDVASGALLREIGQPEAMRIPLVAAAFSPDASTLVWSRFKKTTPVIWDVKTGRRLVVFPSRDKGHEAEVVALAYAPDGRYVASGDLSGTVCLWNAREKTLVRRYKAHDGAVSHIAFIPGAAEFASAGADGAVKLWSSEHAGLLTVLRAPDDGVTALMVSRDGAYLYAATADGVIRGWNVPLRAMRGTFSIEDRQVNGLDLSPDGERMAVVGEDGSLTLWNMPESRFLWKKELDNTALFVRFAPDGKTLITAGGDNWVRIWDVASGKLIRRFAGRDS